MISGALRIGSLGNSSVPSVLFRRPARIASSSNVRLIATMPPMPRSTHAMPIGIGWKSSAVMKTMSE